MSELGRDIFARPEKRLEGRAKVTGEARYTADLQLPGMLWGAVLRSPYPHALVRSVNTKMARGVHGIHAILTGEDVGGVRFGRYLMDWPVLATDRVRFIGDRVVAVAGETREAVEEALVLIDVDYEELPAVLDVRAAVAPGAPVLHPDASRYRVMKGTRGPVPHPNVQGQLVEAKGEIDIERALSSADLVVESHFTTPRQHHGFIEPHLAAVWLEEEGKVHVVSTNKAPFTLVHQMATCIGLPDHLIEIDNTFIGGDFGGKGLSIDEFVCYYLARATGRPVRSMVSYQEEISATNTRHASTMRLRTGVNLDGSFVAHASELVFDGGAYAAAKPSPQAVLRGAGEMLSAYAIAHARIELTTVYTNTVPGGHMRSPGAVQSLFAGESHVDEIAERLGIDALELRRRNVVRHGDSNAMGEVFHEPAGLAVLDAARSAIRWDALRPRGRGVGIALQERGAGAGRAIVIVRALSVGSFEVLTGAVDQGGGTYTALRRIVAAVLEVAEENVSVTHRPTSHALYDSGTGADRTLRIVGEATKRGATILRDQLSKVSERVFPIEATGEFEASDDHSSPSFVATAVEVDVDLETGNIRVVDAVLAVDVGQVINPVAHLGQLEGGFVYGLGAALMEELPVEGGQVLVSGLADYKLPTIADVPPLQVLQVRGGQGTGPFGVKAVGEVSNCGVPPAIANAVADATGIRLNSLPLKAEEVHAALFNQAQADGSREAE